MSASISTARPAENRSRSPSPRPPPSSCTGRVARTVPSVRRASGVVKTSSVGMFATVARPQLVVMPPDIQRAREVRPTVRSVSGPEKCSASNPRSASCRTQRELSQVIAPGLDGVVMVEPDDGGDQAPELIEIGRAQQALGDPLTRPGHERPVHLAAAHRAKQRRRQRHVVCSRPGRVDVREQRRIGVAPDHDHGAAPLHAVGDQPLVPVGDELERVGGRVSQPCPFCVLIPVQHGHVAGSRLVGGFRDGARDRRLLHIHRQHEHVLAGGDVRANLHGQRAQPSRVAVVQRLLHDADSTGPRVVAEAGTL